MRIGPQTADAQQLAVTERQIINAIPTIDPDSRFENCDFVDAKLSELEDVSFTNCRFINAQFASIKAANCRFESCSFYDKDSEEGSNFKFATLRDCKFTQTDLSLADLSRANIYLSTFHNCQLTGANLLQASSCNAISSSIEVSTATFTDCNFAYADLTGAQFPEVDFSGSRMSHTRLIGANFEAATLNDCELHNVEAEDIVLRSADLRGSILSGLDIRCFDVDGIQIDASQAIHLLESLGMQVST